MVHISSEESCHLVCNADRMLLTFQTNLLFLKVAECRSSLCYSAGSGDIESSRIVVDFGLVMSEAAWMDK